MTQGVLQIRNHTKLLVDSVDALDPEAKMMTWEDFVTTNDRETVLEVRADLLALQESTFASNGKIYRVWIA